MYLIDEEDKSSSKVLNIAFSISMENTQLSKRYITRDQRQNLTDYTFANRYAKEFTLAYEEPLK